MPRRFRRAGLAFATALLFAAGAHAADVSCAALASGTEGGSPGYPTGRKPTDKTCIAAYLDGPIQRGDFDKLSALVRANHPFLADLYVNSPGGDAAEAMRIGTLVRKLLVSVEAPFWRKDRGQAPEAELVAVTGDTIFELCSGKPGECGCASSCLIVWAAGARRNGDVLGVAPPAISEQDFGGEPAARAYPKLMRRTHDFLAEMEAPPDVLAMSSAQPGSFTWTKPASGGERYPPSVASWLAASCGTYTDEQRQALLKDIGLQQVRPLSPSERVRLAGEDRLIADVQHCRAQKFRDHRDRADPWSQEARQ